MPPPPLLGGTEASESAEPSQQPSTEPPNSGVPSSGVPSTRPPAADPVISRIEDAQWAKIVQTGTWRPGCPAGRSELRRLDINFVNFAGTVDRGAMVANKDTVADLAEIFTSLFEAGFPIERMQPSEDFAGDLDGGLMANNTAVFNCRKPGQINAPVLDSPHANGRAIDINPYQNPWHDPHCDCWMPSADYAHDRVGSGVITKGSLPWRLFTDRGWVWQNIKVPDYMHFDTGYPSRPR